MASPAPIGVFDSGVGGLTVVRELRARLPREPLIYLGDTARVPYGTKSPDVVTRYALNCARFLVERGAKALVIACNTASAVAVPQIAATFAVPVLGVIEPGARAAAARGTGRVGVIGTEGTITSGRYQTLIRELSPAAEVYATPCPLFVPLAEEGMVEHPATELLAREYLEPLLAHRIDTLVLGCTHYPLLRPLLGRVCGPEVTIIDSATAVAAATAELLETHDLRSPGTAGAAQYFATDVSERLERVGALFLGEPIAPVEWVDIRG